MLFLRPITVAPPVAPNTCSTKNLPEGNVLSCRGITQAQADSAYLLAGELTGTYRGEAINLFCFRSSIGISIPSTTPPSLITGCAGIRLRASRAAAVVSRGIESFGNDYVKDDWGIARVTSTLSTTMTNELRYQYGRDFEYENGQPPIAGEPVSQFDLSPQVSVGGVGNFTFGMPNFLNRPAFPDERRNQLADTVAWSHNTHLFKFGFDFNHVHDTDINLFEQFGAYSYNTRADYISDFTAAAINPANPPLLCNVHDGHSHPVLRQLCPGFRHSWVQFCYE